MIVLIPLGGIGERFKKNKYNKPKALIKLFGKPILYHLLDNLNLKNIDIICIPYNIEYELFNFENNIVHDYPDIKFKFVKLQNNTKGAAESINICLKHINNFICDKPIICLDGDNFYTFDIISKWNGQNRIITFEDINSENLYSYIKIDENNKIVDIIEKQKISNLACCGAYGFSSYKQLLKYTQIILDKQIKQNGEYYTSNVIKEMILDNIFCDNYTINNDSYHCIGTPIQLRYYYNNLPKISALDNSIKIQPKRICFDLDNTLVTYPEIPNDYSTVKPITKNIDFLKYLKSFGNTIIIYTARRMKTHKGNIGKCMYDIGKITFDTLQKYDIPFDEIYFGKPYADVYIDDLALNCYDDLEKELGYYMDKISPRDFNTLELNTIDIYKKKSSDLSGEIYYYNNIPLQVKDLFPLFIDYDVNNKWYTLEKIKGICVSQLFTSELLNIDTLYHIMGSIKRLHDTLENKNNSNINIYENYANKMTKRYHSYDYSIYPKHNEVFNYLLSKLTEYEFNNCGKCVVIHGDPVMTNIIINNFGKIKFIDVRGKQGDILTIYGDYLYDWAKLYQSLIGYDEILLNKTISDKYKLSMLMAFEQYFIELYSKQEFCYLKIITKSLLFTLIPLHNNELCNKFYMLIDTIT
jgi:capsule biosynthesis phosphatase